MAPGHTSPPLQHVWEFGLSPKMRIINEHVENIFEHKLSMNLGVHTHGEFQKLCQVH
jgi:hypothetical protein